MNELPCEVCLDLLPLVQDGVASAESCRLVEQHIQSCSGCRALYQQPPCQPEEGLLVQRVKRRLYLAALAVIFVGVALGVALTDSAGVFYNVMLMPALGILGSIALKKRGWLVPAGLFACAVVWLVPIRYQQGMGSYSTWYEILQMACVYAAVYAALCSVGTLIGWLLQYAFSKEKADEV